MALLRGPRANALWSFWLCSVVTCGLVGCSFVLDPDELRAELAQVEVDTAPQDTDAEPDTIGDLDDGVEGDTPEDTDTALEDTAPEDTDTEPGDTTQDDTEDTDTEPGDTTQDDTEDADTEPGDTTQDDTEDADTEPGDTTPDDTESEVDTGPVTQLVVETSGAGNCILDFYLQGLTSCPKTCGWTLVFDARNSTGISSFSWRLSVNNGYQITPSAMTGPIASVVISTPACLFFPAASMRPAEVTADVSIDGGPWVRAAVLPFTTRQVTTCGPSLCAPP